jgi:hypothetical protein
MCERNFFYFDSSLNYFDLTKNYSSFVTFSIFLIHVSSCVLGEGSVSIMLMSRYMLLLYQAQSQTWIQNCNEIPENDQFYYESPSHWIFQELDIWLLKIWIWWCLALKVICDFCVCREGEKKLYKERIQIYVNVVFVFMLCII